MTPTTILAIDPGSQDGAAVLRRGGGAPSWWTWTWLNGKGGRYRVRTSEGKTFDRRTLHGVGVLISLAICDGEPWTFVVEGLYANSDRRRTKRAKSQAQGAIVLAECAGMVMGPLLDLDPQEVHRPSASKWRAEVLGVAGVDAKRAETYAVDWSARRGLVLPLGLTLAEEGAISEAFVMAVWPLARKDWPAQVARAVAS